MRLLSRDEATVIIKGKKKDILELFTEPEDNPAPSSFERGKTYPLKFGINISFLGSGCYQIRSVLSPKDLLRFMQPHITEGHQEIVVANPSPPPEKVQEKIEVISAFDADKKLRAQKPKPKTRLILPQFGFGRRA